MDRDFAMANAHVISFNLHQLAATKESNGGEDYVDLGAHDDVGLVVRLPLLLAPVLPPPLERKARKQDCLAAADCGGASRVLRVEQIRQHRHTAARECPDIGSLARI